MGGIEDTNREQTDCIHLHSSCKQLKQCQPLKYSLISSLLCNNNNRDGTSNVPTHPPLSRWPRSPSPPGLTDSGSAVVCIICTYCTDMSERKGGEEQPPPLAGTPARPSAVSSLPPFFPSYALVVPPPLRPSLRPDPTNTPFSGLLIDIMFRLIPSRRGFQRPTDRAKRFDTNKALRVRVRQRGSRGTRTSPHASE